MGSTGAITSMTPGMHDINIDGGKVRYEIESYAGTPASILIHGIEVPADKRGRGLGTKLLNRVIKVSDKMGLTIELFAIPIKDSTMTQEELINWYKNRGFTEIPGSIMQYKPKR